jgi:site-specific DNA recombinase
LRSPEIIVRTWRVARQSLDDLTESDVREALERLDPLWDELFPAEQARIMRLLVERVTVTADGLAIDLRTDGFGTVVREMLTPTPQEAIA